MRLMEAIRRKGHVGLWIFMGFMTNLDLCRTWRGFWFQPQFRCTRPGGEPASKRLSSIRTLAKTGAVMTVKRPPVSDKLFNHHSSPVLNLR